MTSDDKIQEKLEPVSFDEVVDRLKLLHFTKSFPWVEKYQDEAIRQTLFETLNELWRVRKQIDAHLCPYKPMNCG